MFRGLGDFGVIFTEGPNKDTAAMEIDQKDHSSLASGWTKLYNLWWYTWTFLVLEN